MNTLTGPNWTLMHADARAAFLSLPAGSVQTLVTSPPYWGLRDYGLPPLAWGGDSSCEHEWGETLPGSNRGGSGTQTSMNGRGENYSRGAARGQFCRKCEAWNGCLGLEPSPELYVRNMVEVFRAVRHALRDDGTLWLNLGDTFAGGGKVGAHPGGGEDGERFKRHWGKHGDCAEASTRSNLTQPNRMPLEGIKPKDLVGIPWMVAFALRADGWYLRNDIIWHKPNAMPQSVQDRLSVVHEHIFLLTKSRRYYFDQDAIREPCESDGGSSFGKVDQSAAALENGAQARRCERSDRERYIATGRNKRSVWRVSTRSYKGAHFAVFPPNLVLPCILAGTSEKGACPKCGAPWARIAESVDTGIPASGNKFKKWGQNHTAERSEGAGSVERHSSIPWNYQARVTHGWEPTCKCGIAETVPCVVADNFTGSGTVLQVAINTGRRFVGSEYATHYLELIQQRAAEPWDPNAQKRPAAKKRKRRSRERLLFG